jgi:spore germination cell wall hydrolase CwlJ-like protein
MKISSVLSGVTNTALASAMCIGGYISIQHTEAKEFVQSFSKKEIRCLQQNVYFEARNQSVLGQASVAWVTLNRVNSKKFPNTICDVIWQNKQFSWTHDGKSDKPKNLKAWETAQQVSYAVLYDYAFNKSDPTAGALFYHADYVKPYWSASFKVTKQIDSHIFYK